MAHTFVVGQHDFPWHYGAMPKCSTPKRDFIGSIVEQAIGEQMDGKPLKPPPQKPTNCRKGQMVVLKEEKPEPQHLAQDGVVLLLGRQRRSVGLVVFRSVSGKDNFCFSDFLFLNNQLTVICNVLPRRPVVSVNIPSATNPSIFICAAGWDTFSTR